MDNRGVLRSRRWGGDGDGEKSLLRPGWTELETAGCLLTRAWRNPTEGNGREKGGSGGGPVDESAVGLQQLHALDRFMACWSVQFNTSTRHYNYF